MNPQPEFSVSLSKEKDIGRITQTLVEELRDEVSKIEGPARRVLVLDGFLLFTPSVPPTFRSLLSLKLLLRAPYAEAKERREARSGYETMEGWWEDPPGYFDSVVWPNYVQENGGWFVDGHVEGEVDEEVCGSEGVKVQDMGLGKAGLGEVLRWVVREIGRVVGEKR